MSSALVRQALDLVDNVDNSARDKKRKSSRRGQGGDERRSYDKRKKSKSEPNRSESVVDKLLSLTKCKSDPRAADKLVSRAVSGKPAAGDREHTEKEESILFEDRESFGQFEKEHFCSR